MRRLRGGRPSPKILPKPNPMEVPHPRSVFARVGFENVRNSVFHYILSENGRTNHSRIRFPKQNRLMEESKARRNSRADHAHSMANIARGRGTRRLASETREPKR